MLQHPFLLTYNGCKGRSGCKKFEALHLALWSGKENCWVTTNRPLIASLQSYLKIKAECLAEVLGSSNGNLDRFNGRGCSGDD
jgi:hypothetical protein